MHIKVHTQPLRFKLKEKETLDKSINATFKLYLKPAG